MYTFSIGVAIIVGWFCWLFSLSEVIVIFLLSFSLILLSSVSHRPLSLLVLFIYLSKQLCKQNGITLIEIPYWWRRDTPSLVATIKLHRSELLEDHDVTQGRDHFPNDTVD